MTDPAHVPVSHHKVYGNRRATQQQQNVRTSTFLRFISLSDR